MTGKLDDILDVVFSVLLLGAVGTLSGEFWV